MYEEEGINIGVIAWEWQEGYMYDQDLLEDFPEIEDFNLGEIYMSESGFIGLVSDNTTEEITKIFTDNNFLIK